MKWRPVSLTAPELVTGIAVKILLGSIYGYIYLHFYSGDDTWRFHQNSLQETNLLLSDPLTFFKNDLTPLHALEEGNGWADVIRLYLIDLQYAILVKPLAVLNILTRGNYYVNTAMFNCVIFAGHYFFFAALVKAFPDKRRYLYYSIFLFLPAVFWLSGLRIDGLLFLFFSLYFYLLSLGKWFKHSIYILLAFAGIIICRTETAVLLVPATIGLILSNRLAPVKSFIGVYVFSIILFFASALLPADGELPAAIARKQAEFLKLEGTRFRLEPLTGSFVSYVEVFPQALSNTYIRPFPWEAKGILQLMAAGEIILFWGLVVCVMQWHVPDWRKRIGHPLILFLMFFSFTAYLSIGYLVPFPGAIIRYKAIALLATTAVMAIIFQSKSDRKFL